MKTKICSKCGKEKNVKEFYADKKQKSGLYPSCKQCKTNNVKKYQKGNRKIMTLKQKLLQELKQNGKMNLKDLQNKFGRTTHIELIELVNDRKIGMVDAVGHDLKYYIKQ